MVRGLDVNNSTQGRGRARLAAAAQVLENKELGALDLCVCLFSALSEELLVGDVEESEHTVDLLCVAQRLALLLQLLKHLLERGVLSHDGAATLLL